jgi:putative acetyltransferase
MTNISISKESKFDIEAIRQVVFAAFETNPHSNQTEHLLVEKLRDSGALTISLVAELDGLVVGHIAFSPVTINKRTCAWYALAPVSVLPAFQRHGIGSMLIKAGLAELHELEASGCVLLGEPEYYGRFGFVARDGLSLTGVPPEYFLALPFTEENIQGEVAYHEAFELCG